MHRAAECFRWLLFQHSFAQLVDIPYIPLRGISRLIYRTSKQNSESCT